MIWLAIALQVGAGTGPDYAQLAPALVEAAEASFRSAEEEHVALSFGSFVSGMEQAGIPTSEQQLRQSLNARGRSFEDRTSGVSCETRPCSWAAGSTRLHVKLNALSITAAGVRAEVAIQARVESGWGFVTNVIVYEMVWGDDRWRVASERVKLRS